MHLEAMPFCCGALLVGGFNDSWVAVFDDEEEDLEEEGVYEPEDLGYQHIITPDRKEDILEKLEDYIEEARRYQFAMLIATTNNEQTKANWALRKAGFKATKYMKGKHTRSDGTSTRLWHLPLQEM